MKGDYLVIADLLLEHPWVTPTGVGALILPGRSRAHGGCPGGKAARLLAAGSLLPVALLTLVLVRLSGLSVGLEALQALVPELGRLLRHHRLVEQHGRAAMGAGLAVAALFAAGSDRWPRARASGPVDPGPWPDNA